MIIVKCSETYQTEDYGPVPARLAKASSPAAAESPVTQRNKTTFHKTYGCNNEEIYDSNKVKKIITWFNCSKKFFSVGFCQ